MERKGLFLDIHLSTPNNNVNIKSASSTYIFSMYICMYVCMIYLLCPGWDHLSRDRQWVHWFREQPSDFAGSLQSSPPEGTREVRSPTLSLCLLTHLMHHKFYLMCHPPPLPNTAQKAFSLPLIGYLLLMCF